MHSLCIIHLYPVLIWQQISVDIVAHIWITILIDLSILSICLPMLIAIFLLNEAIVSLESLCASSHDSEHARIHP